MSKIDASVMHGIEKTSKNPKVYQLATTNNIPSEKATSRRIRKKENDTQKARMHQMTNERMNDEGV